MRSHIFPVVVLALCGLGVLTGMVCADEHNPRITHIYFEKDGVPYNEPVHYTVACYLPRQGPSSQDPSLSRTGETGNLSEVFSYTATCPSYGCPIYEPYYRVNFMEIASCNLYGETRGVNFSVTNFSDQPFSECSGPLQDFISLDYPEPNTPYYRTEEYVACNSLHRNTSSEVSHTIWETCVPSKDPGCFAETLPNGIPLKKVSVTMTVRNGTDMDLQKYIRYLETCDPVTDPDCPGAVINGKPLKSMNEFRPFRNASLKLRDPCDVFLVQANHSLIVTDDLNDEIRIQIMNGTHDLTSNIVNQICDSRWTIPSDIFTNSTTSIVSRPPYVPQSPVESLYCTILNLFGARC